MMSNHIDFIEKSQKQIVYWKNTVDNEYAVYKLTPAGDTYTKHENLGDYKSNDSKLAFDSRFYYLQEITE